MKRFILEYPKGLLQKTEFVLEGETTVGRSRRNDISIEDPGISRRHARLTTRGGEWFLWDLSSSNGTFVNGQKIDICPLHHGDTIRIGEAQLRFLEMEGGEDASSVAATLETPPCQRTVTVSFRRLETGDLHDNDDWGDVGPLFGSFYVGDDHRRFESNYRLEVRERSHSISAFFPRTDFAVDLDPADSLYIGATIMDRDPGRNPNDTIFDFEEIIQSGELVTGEHRLTGRGGSAVVVYITVMPGL